MLLFILFIQCSATKYTRLHLSALQVFGTHMGPGESSGSHMMPGGSPGMGPGMGSQFMGQQAYGDAVTKGYGQSIMYGRPSPAYNSASAYGGRYSNIPSIALCSAAVVPFQSRFECFE